MTRLVLLDAALPDHDFSEEVELYALEEERLLEAADIDAAVELNLRFWCPDAAERVRPMVAGALEWEGEGPETIDLGAVPVPTLVAWSGRTTGRTSTLSPSASRARFRTPSLR